MSRGLDPISARFYAAPTADNLSNSSMSGDTIFRAIGFAYCKRDLFSYFCTRSTMPQSRKAHAESAKTDTLLAFARLLIQNCADVTDSEVIAVRAAGWTEGEVGEIVANVGHNVFTNYFNNVARTDVDFPKVELLAEA